MVMRSERQNTYRVLMNYIDCRGWRISFLEPDCKTSLPLTLRFASDAKIRILHQRFGSPLLEDKQALEHGLSTGRGSAWLTHNREQYLKLKRR